MRRSGDGEKGRYLPWSKEEEGAYIFGIKQVPGRCSPCYMWGLVFYSHVESTCMTASFHKEGRFRTIKLVWPGAFHFNGCSKPGKTEVMYLCVRDIDFVYFYNFSIGFWKCSNSVVHSVFIIYQRLTPENVIIFSD